MTTHNLTAMLSKGLSHFGSYISKMAVVFALVLSIFAAQAVAQEIMPSYSTVPTGWTTDRYEPASFSNVGTYQGRNNVLGIGINNSTAAANRPSGQQGAFYNTQGRKFAYSPKPGAGSTLSAMLYIPASWASEATGSVRSEVWATLVDAGDVISFYPVVGFTNYSATGNGTGRFRYWNGAAMVDLPTPVAYNAWTRFSIRLNADTSIDYFINGSLVASQAATNSSAKFNDAIMQAYNFDGPGVPDSNIADYTAHWSNVAPTVVTVNTTALNGWFLAAENTAGGSGSFVHGPGTPPNGGGSARLQIPTSANGYILAREGLGGTRLDQLTSLSYSTYRTAGGPALAPSFFLTVDNDLNDADTGFKGRLNYEPYHTETVNTGVWQTWTPFTATSNWWFSNGTLATASGCTMLNPCSLTEVLAAFPNAGFRNALGSPMGFKVGSGWAGGFDGNVDSLLIGTNSQETLYDFEADPVTHVVDDNLTECPSAGFTNISAAIGAALSGDIIQVCPGTYNESPQINKSLTVQSTGGRDVTTIQLLPSGTPGTAYTGAIHIDNASANVSINGFTIIGNDAVGSGLANSNVLVRTANLVTLTNNRIKVGAPGTGFNGDDGIGIVNYYGLPTNSITVTNNEFLPTNTEGFRAFYGNAGLLNFVVQNNQILGHFTRRHMTEARTNTVSDNVVTGTGPGSGFSGGLGVDNYLNYYPGQSSTFTGNIVSNVSAGLWIGYYSAVSNVTATGNSFINNQYGVSVFAGSSGITLNYNRISGNSIAGVRNNSGSLNAPNNWWGCNYGPGAGGPGCPTPANGITGSVTATPYLTLRSSAAPGGVLIGGTSTISSSLTFNNLNVDTSGSGFVRNGTPASYVGTLGTVAPNPSTTASGVTSAVFTAGLTPGTGGVATTVDGQTINNPIGVFAGPCVSVSIPTTITTLKNQQVTVPVNVDEMTGRGAFTADYTVTWNPAVMSYVGNDIVGTIADGSTITVNSLTPGQLIVSVFNGGSDFTGSGVFMNLRFNATGPIGSITPVTFNGFIFNNNNPCTNETNGQVEIISSTVSGRIVYVNSPTTKYVPYTTVTGTSNTLPTPGPTVSDMSDLSGIYSLSGFGAGAYTVTPTKSGDVNGITSFDAGQVARHTVGLITLNSNQLLSADVSQDSTVNSFDAGNIARYIVSNPSHAATGTWVFVPTNRNYANVETAQANQDFNGILLGDVDGSWAPPTMFAELLPELAETKDDVRVTLPQIEARTGEDVAIPIRIENISGKNVFDYQFELRFNPKVLDTGDVIASTLGTISEGLSATAFSPEEGLVKVAVYGVSAIQHDGVLLEIRLNVKGETGTTSLLEVSNVIVGDGTHRVFAKSGNLSVQDSENSISGSLSSRNGQLVSNARVLLTDSTGKERSTTTGSLGIFEFTGLERNQSYTVSVRGGRHSFQPQTIVLTENAMRLEMVSEQ